MDIMELPSGWRQDLMPASFRGAYFHVEVGGHESGRHIVLHEFPKKEDDLPYAEDMVRRAREYRVEGYVIQFGSDSGGNREDADLYQRDYRIARDKLIRALEQSGPAWLQLPTMPRAWVMCARFRQQERRVFGGFCEFDMHFVERGIRPFNPTVDSAYAIQAQEQALQGDIANGYRTNSNTQPP